MSQAPQEDVITDDDDDILTHDTDLPNPDGFSVATNSLANRQCHGPIFSGRIQRVDSLKDLYDIRRQIKALLAADQEGFISNESLTRPKILKLLKEVDERAAVLVHQNTSLGFSCSKDVPLDVLRQRGGDNEFTHTSMRLLTMLLSQAKDGGYLPFLYQALKDRRFHRALRQPRGMGLQTNTWRTITEYCRQPQPPASTVAAAK